MKRALILITESAILLLMAMLALTHKAHGQNPLLSSTALYNPIPKIDKNVCYGMFKYDPAKKLCVVHIWFIPPPSKVACVTRKPDTDETRDGVVITIDCTSQPELSRKERQ